MMATTKKNRLHLACILLINFALLLGGCSSANEKQLTESICIETSEGCTRVISKGAILPTSYSEEYSNHEADQDQIGIMLYGGEDSKTESNRLIGEFHIPIRPPANAGDARVQVTILIDASKKISIIAKDLDSGRQDEFMAGTAK